MKVPVKFISEGHTICGNFFPTTGESYFPTVLLLHGFPGNEEDVLGLGYMMSQYSINTLTFNYRGTYCSEGTYSISTTFEDIQAALEYLHKDNIIHRFRIDTSRLVLGGYSYGGGMAVAYAAKNPEIKRVFSVGGTDHGEFAREYTRNTAFSEMINAFFEELKYPTGPVHFRSIVRDTIQELVQNPNPYDLRLCAKCFSDRDLLLICGWDDSNVTIEHHILPLYRLLVNEKAQVSIKAFQDTHVFGKFRDEIARTIIDWVKN